MIYRNNMFVYGEVGERLSGIRESEIYKQSAQRIENLIINEMGNLKIAKSFDFAPFENSIIWVADTKYDFYITINKNNEITTYRKDGDILTTKIATNKFTVTNPRIFKMCEDRLFIIGDKIEVFEFKNGNIGKSNFLDLIKLPIKEKEIVKMDIYRTYQVQNELRVALLGSYENPKLVASGGQIKLKGSNTVLSRIYKEFKAGVDKDNIDGITKGLTFGVLHYYYEPTETKKYYLGNTAVNFGGEKTDSKYGGSYFTSISNGDGELNFGEVININTKASTVGIYQDRLIIVCDGTFYFSKKSDYFDFRNDTKIDSAFFFKPTPINNVYPEIYDIHISDKVFVPTSRGVYVISTNNILTSNAYAVFIASETPANEDGKYNYKNACLITNNTFYYLTSTKELRSVEIMPTSQGIESYSNTLVEKYEINSKFDKIFKFIYNDKNYVVAYRGNQGNTTCLYMYEQTNYKMFRRFSLIINKKLDDILFFNRTILSKNGMYRESINNVGTARIRINPPHMETEEGGNYSADYSSRVVRVFIKVLNEEKKAIKGIRIGKTLITKSAIEDDLFSVFKIETSFQVLNGFDIEIITTGNDKILEILGIDIKVEVYSD